MKFTFPSVWIKQACYSKHVLEHLCFNSRLMAPVWRIERLFCLRASGRAWRGCRTGLGTRWGQRGLGSQRLRDLGGSTPQPWRAHASMKDRRAEKVSPGLQVRVAGGPGSEEVQASHRPGTGHSLTTGLWTLNKHVNFLHTQTGDSLV